MAKDPAYPMYAQDFDMDTADWGVDEVGIYIRLLNYQWINGYLPDDLHRIAKIARVSLQKLKKKWTLIEIKFSKNSAGNLQNKRMEEEREKRIKYVGSQSRSGKKGAKGKWGNSTKNGKTRSERLRIARKKGTHTKEEFQKMVNYFNGVCVKCGEKEDGVFRDHIIPVYQGGSDGIDNLQPLCRKCNTGKGPENIDYRIAYCKKHSLKMPGEWSGETSGETSGEHMASLSLSLSLLDLSNDKSENQQPDIDFDKDKKKKKTPPAAHADLSKKDLKKTSKHFSENVGNLFESILKSCKTISKLPGQKTKRPFNPYQFVQKHVNEKRHPGVIDETLKAVSKYWDGIRGDIYTYANAIVKTKNKNWNEKEAIAIHVRLKAMDVPMLNKLTGGLFKIL